MNVQVIEKGGRPEWAVTPYEEYQRLLEDAEMLQDARAFDEAKQALAAGEELVPSEVTYAILDGGNPVRVWREHRGLTQQQVARAAGISVPYLSQIESGKRKGSAAVLSAIARELKITLEDVLDSGGAGPPREDCPAAPDRCDRPADRRAGVRALWTDGGGDQDPGGVRSLTQLAVPHFVPLVRGL